MFSPTPATPPVKPTPPPHGTVPAGHAACPPESKLPGGTGTGALITR